MYTPIYDNNDHETQLQFFECEYSSCPIDLTGSLQLLCQQEALRSPGCVHRCFLCRHIFRKVLHCIQKKSDIVLPSECFKGFRLLMERYFTSLIERHLISSCTYSELCACGDTGICNLCSNEQLLEHRNTYVMFISIYMCAYALVCVQTKVWHFLMLCHLYS